MLWGSSQYVVLAAQGFPFHISGCYHDDVIKWEQFPRYWPFLQGIHRWPHKGQWRGAFDVFFDLRLNKLLSKQSWGWWFETQSRSLWRHRNDHFQIHTPRTLSSSSIIRASRQHIDAACPSSQSQYKSLHNDQITNVHSACLCLMVHFGNESKFIITSSTQCTGRYEHIFLTGRYEHIFLNWSSDAYELTKPSLVQI